MADQTVRVRVTQEDIDAGVRADCLSCPVARAVGRVVPSAESVWVNFGIAEVKLGGRLHTLYLPDKVMSAIIDFDFSGFMEPFEFDLPLPTEPEVAASVEHNGDTP